MSKQNEINHLVQNLVRIGSNLEKLYNRALAEFDLTQQQFIVLNETGRSQPICARRIASELGDEKSNLSKIIHKLSILGYIETIREPEDKRIKRIQLTVRGAKICKECLERLNRENKKIFHPISRMRARRLKNVTSKIYQTIAKTS